MHDEVVTIKRFSFEQIFHRVIGPAVVVSVNAVLAKIGSLDIKRMSEFFVDLGQVPNNLPDSPVERIIQITKTFIELARTVSKNSAQTIYLIGDVRQLSGKQLSTCFLADNQPIHRI